MYLSNIFKTLVSKGFILVLNFFTVILSTHIWGPEGRGIISIMLADMAIIVIFNNILAGSSVSFMVPKFGIKPLLLPAYIWTIVISVAGTAFFALLHTHHYPYYLLFLTLTSSLFSINLMAFIGHENIKWYNIFSALLPLFTVVLIIIYYLLLKHPPTRVYFDALLIAQMGALLLSWIIIFPHLKRKNEHLTLHLVRNTFSYGWRNELSYLLQFLNYRLSYFFILYFRDVKAVGIFSIGIALAESIWLMSKSISTNQYAKIINSNDSNSATELTRNSAKLSLYTSLLLVAVLVILPKNVYGIIFGKEFIEVKQIFFIIIPGIIAIAVSNIHGHYFSATRQQKILIIKSALGLVATIILSFILIPWLGIYGACITVAVSYLISSVYLFQQFYRQNKYRKHDFILTKSDLQMIMFWKRY